MYYTQFTTGKWWFKSIRWALKNKIVGFVFLTFLSKMLRCWIITWVNIVIICAIIGACLVAFSGCPMNPVQPFCYDNTMFLAGFAFLIIMAASVIIGVMVGFYIEDYIWEMLWSGAVLILATIGGCCIGISGCPMSGTFCSKNPLFLAGFLVLIADCVVFVNYWICTFTCKKGAFFDNPRVSLMW